MKWRHALGLALVWWMLAFCLFMGWRSLLIPSAVVPNWLIVLGASLLTFETVFLFLLTAALILLTDKEVNS